MAVKSMSYDHPQYLVAGGFQGEIGAAASAKTARWAAFTALALKSVQVSVTTVGGTANVVQVVRIAAGGTALTTMASVNNAIGTHVAGVTTNVLMTHAAAGSIAQGDILYVEKGAADGAGVYAVALEYVVRPGADVTT